MLLTICKITEEVVYAVYIIIHCILIQEHSNGHFVAATTTLLIIHCSCECFVGYTLYSTVSMYM